MTDLDAVDFSERRSEEVIFFFYAQRMYTNTRINVLMLPI